MEFREMLFPDAQAAIEVWRKDATIEEVEPGVEVCDCPKQGMYDIIDAIAGHYENSRYTGQISGVLMKCDICGKQVFATMQSHFVLD